ncbi:hypothetical protein D9V86_11250 [Bacteroidetes/Chlorobi group bacterium ChocPot_Mid]|nr:MAG: hypothetical protein D9V86_11250 [Bacteroidetes/Chlorobi group bacterium ChocPot_Mid]
MNELGINLIDINNGFELRFDGFNIQVIFKDYYVTLSFADRPALCFGFYDRTLLFTAIEQYVIKKAGLKISFSDNILIKNKYNFLKKRVKSLVLRTHATYKRFTLAKDSVLTNDCSFPLPPIIFFKSFYLNNMLLKDYNNYSALRLLYNDIYFFIRLQLISNNNNNLYIDILDEFNLLIIRSFRDGAIYKEKDIMEIEESGILARLFDVLNNWRTFFSPDNNVSHALNKTLDLISDGFPCSQLRLLPAMTLDRPYTQFELLSYLISQDSINHNIFKKANESDIIKAMSIYYRMHRMKLKYNISYLENFVYQIVNYSEIHNGKIQGLTRKYIRHYRKGLREYINENDDDFNEQDDIVLNVEPQKPIFQYQKISNLKFLDDATSFYQESKFMHHCIKDLLNDASKGFAYVFHYQASDGSHATVLCDEKGNIIDVKGPENIINVACYEIKRIWVTPSFEVSVAKCYYNYQMRLPFKKVI